MENTTKNNASKVVATAIIWSLATGIMAICIPLVKISESGFILPLTVIIGVSISTVAIWLSDNRKAIKSSNNFQQIEERIRVLETISNIEDLDIKGKLSRPDKTVNSEMD